MGAYIHRDRAAPRVFVILMPRVPKLLKRHEGNATFGEDVTKFLTLSGVNTGAELLPNVAS